MIITYLRYLRKYSRTIIKTRFGIISRNTIDVCSFCIAICRSFLITYSSVFKHVLERYSPILFRCPTIICYSFHMWYMVGKSKMYILIQIQLALFAMSFPSLCFTPYVLYINTPFYNLIYKAANHLNLTIIYILYNNITYWVFICHVLKCEKCYVQRVFIWFWQGSNGITRREKQY